MMRHLQAFVPCLLLMPFSWGAGTESALVFPGPDGKLAYAGYANEGQPSTGNRMIDFSMAGYEGGGVAIPWVPVEVALDPIAGDGDDHARIQAAIDTVSALPLSPSGFRGTLLLRAGAYRVSETLHVQASGVVIRGEGQGSGGTVVTFTATQQDNLFEFGGGAGWSQIAGTEQTMTEAVVPSGVSSFDVASSDGFTVGDRVIIHRTPNQAWIDLLDMGQWGWTPEDYACESPRRIIAIDGNTLTVDAPLIHAIETQYGGGEVYRYDFDGAIRKVGIECIRLESAFTSSTDEDHGWSAVLMARVENAWARQVTAKYFGYACVDIRQDSQFVTVEDCAQLDPKSIITGSRRYSFRIDDACFVLFQRCYTEKGRHDYVSQSNTAGPNVFVDSLAEQVHSDIGPHHRYSQGLLFDNIKGGPINVQNRESSGTGHGWSGAQTVFWNCEASSLICDAPKAAMNFAIGCVGSKRQGQWAPGEPDGFWESHQVPVTPRSLYYTQLGDRLGAQALNAVTTSAQRRGRTWSALSSWRGEGEAPGLPSFAPVQVDAGEDFISEAQTAEISAVVRHPLPDEFPRTVVGWTQLSGPAPVVFDDAMVPATAVDFPEPGTYELAYSVAQDDDRDPSEVITYAGSDSVIVTIPVPPDAVGALVSTDSIVGESQVNGPLPGYYPEDPSSTVGTSGSSVSNTRQDRNLVLGFSLPPLTEGETLEAVTLRFEIGSARDQTGPANLPDLKVHLLDVVDPTGSGSEFFFHGSSDPSPSALLVDQTSVTISGTSQNNFAADAEDRTVTLTGPALERIASFYGEDHLPDRSEAFFRFSLSEDPALLTLKRYGLVLDPAESRLEIFSVAPQSSYATWTAGPFAAPLADADPSLDFDAGGLDSGIEWVVGGDPTDASDDVGLSPTFDALGDPEFFVFTYRLTDEADADSATTVIVQYGSDLNGWTDAVPGADVIVTQTPDLFGEGVAGVKVELRRSAIAVEERLFVRLKVQVAAP